MSAPDATPAETPAGPVPAVSVIVPAHDREDSVRSAIASVLDQSFTDLEVIAIDDASRDGTLGVLQAMAREDARLRVLRHDRNRGVSAARNTGIGAARGRLIAFQDSDDLWLPDKLARQIAALEAAPEAVAVWCAMEIENIEALGGADPAGTAGMTIVPKPGDIPRQGEELRALLAQNSISTQMLVVRREALEAVGGFDPRLPALVDWDLVLRLAGLGPLVMVEAPLVRQRFSANSLTRSLEKRLAGLQGILERHGAAFAAEPEILARHHQKIAGTLRRLGDLRGARRHMVAAILARPLSPRRWLKALWLTLRAPF